MDFRLCRYNLIALIRLWLIVSAFGMLGSFFLPRCRWPPAVTGGPLVLVFALLPVALALLEEEARDF